MQAITTLPLTHRHPKRKEAHMAVTGVQILGWWPIAVACVSGITAALVAIRYKIPELARKVEAMETKNPTKSELEMVVDSLHTVCKFNQATCQKSNAAQIAQVRSELHQKLSDLYDLVNKQAVLMARVDERVAVIFNFSGNNKIGGYPQKQEAGWKKENGK